MHCCQKTPTDSIHRFERKKLRNIVFDLGNVLFLIDYAKTLQNLREYLRPEINMPYFFSTVLRGEEFELFNRGKISREAFFNHCCKYFVLPPDQEHFWAQYVNIFLPNQPMLDWIPALARRYQLFVLSNTDIAHIEYLEGTFPEVFSCFSGKTYSFRTGFMKPEREIFDSLTLNSGILPEESLFIDDLQENLSGAAHLGFQTFLFVNNHPELKQILESKNH